MGTDRTRMLPMLLTFLVLLLVVLAAASAGGLSANPVLDVPAQLDQQPAPVPSATVGPAEPTDLAERQTIPAGLVSGTLVVIAVGILALLVRFLARIRRRPDSDARDMEQRYTASRETGAVHALAQQLPGWAEEAHAALASDAGTSDVVIRCWLDFEHHCAQAGIERAPSQTTSDLAAAAASSLGLPAEPLTTLHRLYQRARFGRDDAAAAPRLTPADRDLAAASITELAVALHAHPEASAANGTAR